MKKIFLAMIICLPCLAIFNEYGSFTINLFGFIYTLVLFIASKTKVGSKFCKDFAREAEDLTNKILGV